MPKSIPFYDFEEARIDAGLFFEELLKELEIDKRTYKRWEKKGEVPVWAMRIVELLSGDLAPFGWKEWYIKNGVLFNKSLSDRYSWHPADVVITAWADTEMHRAARKERQMSNSVASGNVVFLAGLAADPKEKKRLRRG